MRSDQWRTLIDPLYGCIALGEPLNQLIRQPELQRLRDVRLSNINSLLMPGGSNVSRFEHSVGTAVLAERVANRNQLDPRLRLVLVSAALLHDVCITPFGHLMEEGIRSAGLSFSHETRLGELFSGAVEVGNISRQIFRGREAGFRRVLDQADYRGLGVTVDDIVEAIDGKGSVGPLISAKVDLDNIDNVCRMCWHIGVPIRQQLAKDVADGFIISSQGVQYDAARLAYLCEWQEARFRLYSVLMTNPSDFSAKAMLIDAVRRAAEGQPGHPAVLSNSSWSLTDSEMLSVLCTFQPVTALMNRFLLGDLYELLGMYWVDASQPDIVATFSPGSWGSIAARIRDEAGLGSSHVCVYAIRDKRRRSIDGLRFRGNVVRPTGAANPSVESPRMLVGAVVDRRDVSAAVKAKVKSILSALSKGAVDVCDPGTHMQDAFGVHATHDAQRRLF